MTVSLNKFGIDDTYLAHTPDETLVAHSDLTFAYLKKIFDAKDLEAIVDKLILAVDKENFELLKELFINTIYLHDIGKKNKYFQAKKMNNIIFKEYKNSSKSSDHSLKSSEMFIAHYIEKVMQLQTRSAREKFKFILQVFSYHQAKHHGALGDLQKYRKDDIHWQYLEKFNIPAFEFYILNKLLFSLLVSCDYYATNEYMAKLTIDDFGTFSKEEKEKLNVIFQKHISQFKNPSGINILRNEIYIEAQTNLLQNLDKNIFYLEAPTGSGKTITSINLALKLLQNNKKLNKLFYIFPFNTLVEQTKNVFDTIFGKNLKVEIINSITPMSIDKRDQEDEETKYQKSYINRLFFHSSCVITTHVALFNILFGTSKEDNFPLWQLANSVIIIDEIQSYNNHLWWYMVDFFDKYASLLNMKIIIMSATLPKLDYFLKEKNNFVSLISDEKREIFFQHKLFKERVKTDFTLIDEEMTIEKLVEILKEQPKDKKILFEFIKKQSARAFYNEIKEVFENVYELSGDDNKAYRQYIINKSKEENLIIVATQVIEAGVDIDMDIGFKDISTLDSEEQFMGRINRSCLKNGIVYFFDLDDATKIYKNDNRLNLDLKLPKYREILQNKEFDKYYKEVLENIKRNGDRFENGLMTNYDNFGSFVEKLNYKEVSKTMTLINSQNFTLYFPFLIELSLYKGVKEFENIDKSFKTDGKLDGQKVWEEFTLLDTIDGFVEREYKKAQLNSLMQFFTFSIFRFGSQQNPPYYSLEYGGYYLVQDLSFIENEKFNREKYLAKKEELFL